MTVLVLGDAAACDPGVAGAKAANLSRLAARGFTVPAGIVVTTSAFDGLVSRVGISEATPACIESEPLPADVEHAIRLSLRPGGALHGRPVAVRSSACAEDLGDASFAGQYETYLDLRDEEQVISAVRRCRASAFAPRVAAYKTAHGGLPPGMAVLVQHFIAPDAAGVAFTAHPVTGERDVVLVSAVRGVGEALVSGQASAEEWEVRGGTATRRRSPAPVIDSSTALNIANLACRIAALEGKPQDIEWAIAGGTTYLLQARPMTALPDPVAWTAPLPGGWVRNFRLGEWLGDPVTPLFESWLVDRVEARFAAVVADVFGIEPPAPYHAVINGWYFYRLAVPPIHLHHVPRMIWHVARHFRQAMAMTPPTAAIGYDAECQRWSSQLLPAYKDAVHTAAARVDSVDLPCLVSMIDMLADHVGDQFASIVGVAGFAAKSEAPLLRFWREHLGDVDGHCLQLVHSVDPPPADGHAVQGLDWYLPTLGELPQHSSTHPAPEIRARMIDDAARLEAQVRAALADRPKRLKQFARLLSTARRAHDVRQRQTGAFTLAWPVMRRAIARIGQLLVDDSVLLSADQVFFLRRDELEPLCTRDVAQSSAKSFPNAQTLAARRAEWTRQRRLTPPMLVGELTGIWKQGFAEMEELLHGAAPPSANEVRGHPGSPGRVTAAVRVLLSLEELDRLQPGEILVAPVTTPGWTPAFAKAAAIVTDTGSVASHASIVAREFGIPAVVATGNATTRLYDGQIVTVDGSRGVVVLAEGDAV